MLLTRNLNTPQLQHCGKMLTPQQLERSVGTAPAFGMTLSSPTPTRIIALPGVPWELHALWERHVADEVLLVPG